MWKTVQYRMVGKFPLIMHSGSLADPTNKYALAIKAISTKRKKTEADYLEMSHLEFLGSLEMGKRGPIIPHRCISAMVIKAAMARRRGNDAKAGVFCAGSSDLQYKGPREAEKLWEQGEPTVYRQLVRIGPARLMRTRAMFGAILETLRDGETTDDGWMADVTLRYDDSILDTKELDEWMKYAGAHIGCMERRPVYGRFYVEKPDSDGEWVRLPDQ